MVIITLILICLILLDEKTKKANLSEPMSKEDAIKHVKEQKSKGITGYIVSQEESIRMETPENFNKPKWN